MIREISTQCMDLLFETQSKAPKKEYLEMNAIGKKIAEAFEGKKFGESMLTWGLTQTNKLRYFLDHGGGLEEVR